MPREISPHGFVVSAGDSLATDNEYKRFSGSEEIAELYRTHIQRKQNTLTWDFRSKVVSAAMLMLGRNLRSFIHAQLRNPYLHGVAFDFMDDTLQFILTGHRAVSLHNWSALLEEEPAKKAIDTRRTFKARVPDELAPMEEVISYWCSQEGGFEDLLRTLYLMFGKKR